MSYILRDYQLKAVECAQAKLQEVNSTCIIHATGLGKTPTAAELILRFQPKRTLFLAPKAELVLQAKQKIEYHTGLEVEIEMNVDRASRDQFNLAPVVVGTVQTQYARNNARVSDPKDFGLLIIDELHHYTAPALRGVVEHYKQNPNLKICGLSVGPESFVELRGGCFGLGFVGPIETAFELAAQNQIPRKWFDYQIINLRDVYSRGWTGAGFAWKPCLKILRHSGKPCIELQCQGASLIITPEHSIYRAVPGERLRVIQGFNKQTRFRPEIVCDSATRLATGDILIGDDGAASLESEKHIDMIEFCRQHMADSRVKIICDVKSIPRKELRKVTDPKKIYSWREHHSIPLIKYCEIENPPHPLGLAVEGSDCQISPTVDLSDWAYMLGFYLGDGWINSDKQLGFAVGQSQLDEIVSAFSRLPGIRWNIGVKKSAGKSFELKCANVFVANLLLSIFGEIRCFEKFIPGEWIVSWSRENRLQLLQGLIDSDGHLALRPRNRKRHVIVTTSILLAKGLCSLLRSLGLWGSIHRRKKLSGGIVNGRQIIGRHTSYCIHWSDSKTPNVFSHRGKRQRFIHDRAVFTEAPVRAVVNTATPQWVYDLEMSGHPSFVADGILVHNTATPNRTDEAALGQIIESFAHVYELDDAKNDGWLVDIRPLFVPVAGLDYSHLHTVANDFKKDELNAILEEEKIVQRMIQATCEIVWRIPKDSLKGKPPSEWETILKTNGKPRRSIVFCASVKQAEMFSEILNRAVPKSSEWVCDKTPKDERARILARFAKNDELYTICNVNVLGEGYDNPLVEVIVQAKPTKSELWYKQTLGRATRTLPGVIDGLNTKEERLEAIAKSAKPYAITVDFVANCGRHKIISAIDILGGKYSDEVLERATKLAQEKGEEVSVDKLILETEDQIKREAEKRKAQIERRRQEWEKRRNILATAEYQVIEVPAFEVFGLKSVRTRGWDIGRELSDKQKAVLVNNGIKSDGLTYMQQKQLVDEVFKRRDEGKATFRQAEKLRAMGLSVDMSALEAAKVTNIAACSIGQAKVLVRADYNPLNYTIKTASELIDRLAANGWQKLPEADEPPKPNPNAATPAQCDRLRRYHYDTSKLTKKEAQRLIFRLVQNKFKPLPLTDPDHPKNWKEPVEQGEVEVEPELVVQEDMF